MKEKLFWQVIASFNIDNPDTGVVLHMRGGSTMQGILREPAYGVTKAPSGTAWVTTPHNVDVLIDIASVIALRLFDWNIDR